MGTFIGHVAPGAGFLIIGLWHFFNTLRNYARGPWNFEARPWFPVKLCRGKLRHLELYAIMGGSLLSIASELFIGPERHQPLADDLSIPPEHLNNFEHSTISLFLFMYAMVAWLSDTGGQDRTEKGVACMIPFGLVHMVGALAFAQELLLFHLHSADHMGLEGHYHWLLQLIVWVSLLCTLMEVSWPQSFLVALGRTLSLVFQGLWFIQMGFVLWIPAFTPKGCALRQEELHNVVRCNSEETMMRGKALATLQFSWYLAGIVVFAMVSFICVIRFYTANSKYESIEDAITDEELISAQQRDMASVELSMHPFKSTSLNGSDSSMEGLPHLNLGR